MSDATSPVSTPNSAVSGAETTKNAVSQSGAATSNRAGATSDTTVSSMKELREKSPKTYELMEMGIAINICRKMKRHQEELKKLARQYRNNG